MLNRMENLMIHMCRRITCLMVISRLIHLNTSSNIRPTIIE